MNFRTVKNAVLLACLFVVGGLANAQELRTVAVFDANQVVLSFYQDSSLYREYRRAEEEYKEDRLRLEAQIDDYRVRRASALDRNDARTAQSLRENIRTLEEDLLALQERWAAQSEDLVDQLVGDEFWSRMYEVVGYLAEDMGYTLVIDRTVAGMGIFWVSPAIDITEDIIQELLLRYR